MLKHTCLKISIISLVEFPFFALSNLWGKWALGKCSCRLLSSFSFGDKSSESEGFVFSCLFYWHLLFIVYFLAISQGHDGFHLFILLGWNCTYFMHFFRIRNWLAWEFIFLNSHCQGLNRRSKLTYYIF